MPVDYSPILFAIIAWSVIATWLFVRYAKQGGRMPMFRAAIFNFCLDERRLYCQHAFAIRTRHYHGRMALVHCHSLILG
jgi:hypothetical protein